MAWRKKVDDDPTQCPPKIDRSTFFSPTIPSEVRACILLMHMESASETIASVLKGISSYLQAAPSAMTAENFAVLEKRTKLDKGNAGVLLSGLYTILRICIRNKLRPPQISTDLLKMNVPQFVVDGLLAVAGSARLSLERATIDRRLRFPSISRFRWRIDIVISSGLTSRVMRPNILMQMTLSNGLIKSFEVSIEQFNQLRYGVAKVLQEMQTLERHPIMKIMHEIERKDLIERSKAVKVEDK